MDEFSNEHSPPAANQSHNDGSYFEPIVNRHVRSSRQSYTDYGPIDRVEIHRIASMSQASSRFSLMTPGTLEKEAKIAKVHTGHPTLDPTSPEFDVREWLRWYLSKEQAAGVVHGPHGVTFKNLSISGFGPEVKFLETVLSLLAKSFRWGENFGKRSEKEIVRGANGTVKSGEMLLVLGRPGSGCSTFLKGISGELQDLRLGQKSEIHYSGVSQKQIEKNYRGEIAYNQETDIHFPHLTVAQTLRFAATVRTPVVRYNNVSRAEWAEGLAQVVAAAFGLTEVQHTKVGNDWIRGISGGQRKRVSLAEMAMAGNVLGCWDNSTRGLDSATALEFITALRLACDVSNTSHAVTLYQASQAIYDNFDKVMLLYEGQQIYYGPAAGAKKYFEDMGWYCLPRQTTADFLTSVTNPQERKRTDQANMSVPQTADDFERYWLDSDAYKGCVAEIKHQEEEYPPGGPGAGEMREARRTVQSKQARAGSPYTLSVGGQIKACLMRASQRTRNDIGSVVSTIFGQIAIALIIASIYFGTRDATSGLFSKAAVLFFAILTNALLAVSEVNGLYEHRPIVAKQARYGFYHPFAEALATTVLDVPVKFVLAVCFNIVLYFLGGLRIEASRFFVYFLFIFVVTLAMTMVFRTLGAATRTISQALAISGVLVLAISIYTGFTLPFPYMHPWFKWISYINPVFYTFESLLLNEVHDVSFPCGSGIVPYPFPEQSDSFICSVVGAVPGETSVLGDRWVETSYSYVYSHTWRDLGILFAFLVFFLITYLLATEFISTNLSTGSAALQYKRGSRTSNRTDDRSTEAQVRDDNGASNTDPARSQNRNFEGDMFSWSNITYDILIQGSSEPRRLLEDVSGWVEPGTLTALMGTSGAGKTTLLDVLAQRTTTGIVQGEKTVNGRPLGPTFQRSTGYVQQQDLHLATTTVREALQFSAALRQPDFTPIEEKNAYVEEVITMLGMNSYGDALIGDADMGEGLSVEQRKMLSIGVELVAKPSLLIFLDEPTSGLDSQSAYSVISLLRRLANNGQAILATIHQPSAVLFEEFDRLLFLSKGGKTVYFGDLGGNSRTLLDFFERNGGRPCDDSENPAEYILEMVTASKSGQDWHQIWKDSPEKGDMVEQLREMQTEGPRDSNAGGMSDIDTSKEFAVPFKTQLWHVTARVFQQYWRTPSYIYSKLGLSTLSSLFIGFSFFQSDSSQQGLQNAIFSVFSLQTVLTVLIQQIMPKFVVQRTLYEARERPSKMYSWLAFVLSNIAVEIPYQILCGVIAFACFYYPIFGIQSPERQVLVLLFCIQNFVFASTFAQMLVAAAPDAETGGNFSTLLITMALTFNGVMQPPDALPGFWIFMYRVSPFTYLVAGIVAVALHGKEISCSSAEASIFDPPSGRTCGEYLSSYLKQAPGRLLNPEATSACKYCPLTNADQFLASSRVFWSERWRNFGILFVYLGFNCIATIALYWFFRVRSLRDKGKGGFGKKLKDWMSTGGLQIRRFFVRHMDEDKKGREARNDRLF